MTTDRLGRAALIEEFVRDFADEPCVYKDDCPSDGRRHGTCLPCRARRALAEPAEDLEIVQQEYFKRGFTAAVAQRVCSECCGTTRIQVPCPDNKPGCIVYHSILCPSCLGWTDK